MSEKMPSSNKYAEYADQFKMPDELDEFIFGSAVEHEAEADDEVVEYKEHTSAVGRAADRLADFADRVHESRVELQDNFAETIEDKAERLAGGAKQLGKSAVSGLKNAGLITLGLTIIGVEAGAKKVVEAKDYVSEKAGEAKTAIGDKSEKIADFASESKKGVIEFAGNKKSEVISFFKNKKDEAIQRKLDRQSARKMAQDYKEASRINNQIDRYAEKKARAEEKADRAEKRQQAKEKLAQEKNLANAHAAAIRMNNRIDRRVAIEKMKEGVVESINDKKDRARNGARGVSKSIFKFINKAKASGAAAYSTWSDYDRKHA